jgi:hypothetical protein
MRIAVAVLAALALAGTAVTAAGAMPGRALCGTERWSVKTLQDRPHLLSVQTATLQRLTSLPAPSFLPVTRLPFERHVFRVAAAVTRIRSEADGDLQLYLRAGRFQMIAEAPSPACDTAATAALQRAMRTARREVRVCRRALVTGVAFFDYRHGQTGEAPNSVELHPILAFTCSGAG